MLAERVKEWNRQSLEKGMQKGMQKGACDLLVRLLEKKFGTIPDELRHRLEQADQQQILQWSERVLSAESMGDVFGN